MTALGITILPFLYGKGFFTNKSVPEFPLYVEFRKPYFNLAAFPSLTAGTHMNQVSVHGTIRAKLPLIIKGKQWSALSLTLRSSSEAALQYPGFPQPLLSQEAGAWIQTAFGDSPAGFRFFYLNTPPGVVSFGYHYSLWYDTIKTSQHVGMFSFDIIHKKGWFRFRYENDLYTRYRIDRFRTGAGRFEFLWQKDKNVFGAGVDIIFWTGTTVNTKIINGYFMMDGQYGSAYANGIIALTFMINGIKIKAGWDSDKIRDLIQGNIHRMINDGLIKTTKPNPPRVFLQVSVFETGTLY